MDYRKKLTFFLLGFTLALLLEVAIALAFEATLEAVTPLALAVAAALVMMKIS